MAALEVATSADGSTWVGHDEVATGGVAHVTFGSTSTADEYIKQTYDHLLLVASIRSEQTGIKFDIIDMRFNNITTSVYTTTDLTAKAAAVTSATTTARGDFNGAIWPAADVAASTFGCLKIWIPHYANDANFKQVFMSSTSSNTTGADDDWSLRLASGLWAQTAAVTEIEIRSGYAADHAEFSTFTLYGITA